MERARAGPQSGSSVLISSGNLRCGAIVTRTAGNFAERRRVRLVRLRRRGLLDFRIGLGKRQKHSTAGPMMRFIGPAAHAQLALVLLHNPLAYPQTQPRAL